MPDSDFDLRGAHVLPLEKVVGLDDFQGRSKSMSFVIVDEESEALRKFKELGLKI